jgi:hypothetical protein
MENPEQTITIGSDLPCLITPNENPGSQFPFIYQSELIKDPAVFLGVMENINIFRDFVKIDLAKFRRLTSYYLDRNWRHFAIEWKNIHEKQIPVPRTELNRHDRFHRTLELFFGSIQPNLDYLVLKKELAEFIMFLGRYRYDAFTGFLTSITKDDKLLHYQTKLLERLSFMADNFSALAPAFPIMFYDSVNLPDLSEIRIMRDDFDILKSHYLSCFEICHKVLKLPVGLINIFHRADSDAFPDNKPVALDKFDELNFSSAQKIKYLDPKVLPELASRWEIYFDRKLRNSIGHYGIRHDLKTGMLVLDNHDPIPYSHFVASTLKLSTMLLHCLQIVKMMYIMKIILVDGKDAKT